jgi:hypothetical protein
MTSGMTIGLSPVALTQAPAGWAQHLLLSPYEQIGLVHKAARKWARFFPYSIDQPLPQDKRFAGQAWQHWPFKAFYGRGAATAYVSLFMGTQERPKEPPRRNLATPFIAFRALKVSSDRKHHGIVTKTQTTDRCDGRRGYGGRSGECGARGGQTYDGWRECPRLWWTAPDGIDCARMRSLQVSNKGDRPWNRLAELAWTCAAHAKVSPAL